MTLLRLEGEDKLLFTGLDGEERCVRRQEIVGTSREECSEGYRYLVMIYDYGNEIEVDKVPFDWIQQEVINGSV